MILMTTGSKHKSCLRLSDTPLHHKIKTNIEKGGFYFLLNSYVICLDVFDKPSPSSLQPSGRVSI